ncbi:MAG: hypothetical protein D3911_15970 [Candidatus Electrothrix sp. AW3_4]|nr:hypothetical protein [Candidatus Electrothrix gigas]
MQRSYSSFQRIVSLFVIVCFVNALVYSSVYAAAADLPYNADLMLDNEYHDISYNRPRKKPANFSLKIM